MSAVIPVQVHLLKACKDWTATVLAANNIYEQYDTNNGQNEILVDNGAGGGQTWATFWRDVPIPQGCNALDKVVFSAWASTLGTDTFAQIAFVDRAATPATIRDTAQRQTRWSESFREWGPSSGTIVPYDTLQATGEPARLVCMMTCVVGSTQKMHLGDPVFYFRRGGGYQG